MSKSCPIYTLAYILHPRSEEAFKNNAVRCEQADCALWDEQRDCCGLKACSKIEVKE